MLSESQSDKTRKTRSRKGTIQNKLQKHRVQKYLMRQLESLDDDGSGLVGGEYNSKDIHNPFLL